MANRMQSDRKLSTAGILACVALTSLCAPAQPLSTWKVARSEHFEVYSQAGEPAARSALLWFEQLHGFLLKQTGLSAGLPSVRVIGFRSVREYQPYRLRPTADAYCISTESRDYIVMPSLGAAEFPTAAHEYAHAVLHAGSYRLPAWLSEGLAEFFSTVRIGERSSTIGGDLPQRSRELRGNPRIPLPQLLAAVGESSMFYAESWALTDMLALSPEYAPRFHLLIARLASGAPGVQALPAVYSKSLDVVARDLQVWAGRRRSLPLPLPGVATAGIAVEVAEVSSYASRALIADLLAASGALDRAEEQYRALATEAPADGAVFAGLGAIALRRGDSAGARREWRRAIDLGVSDAVLCYRYAVLASSAGMPEEEIRPVLERALALKPDYDDARYHLALLEKNAARYQSAIDHLRAIRSVPPGRAFSYWSATADALNQLGRRDEATAAAREARQFAATEEERLHASQLAYIAATEIAIRMARDREGKVHMVTTRVPHDTPDWNPFIEPEDEVREVTGNLREIDCAGSVTRFLLDTAAGPLALAIPDPSKMQVRNAPPEFTCGPQPPTPVTAVYAAGASSGLKSDGLLRGIRF